MAADSASSAAIQTFPKEGTVENFVEEFMLKNLPCLFDASFTHEWPSRQLWVNTQGQPNLEYLNQEYGEYMVPVADCGGEQFSAHPKSEMKMAEYLKYWSSLLKEREGSDSVETLLYLKDWHLAKEVGPDVFYSTLDYFQSDWLNEVWSLRQDVQDDYRFVYMGPKGTWTPFHADVFRSYSWSTNVCGCKEWLLYPPGKETYLCDRLGNLPFDITSTDLEDSVRYPNASKAYRPICVVQNAGETIFVPSGWHHQVKNLEHTISINHNWTNAFGVKFMWKHLQNELKLVCAELNDCKTMDGWENQCQVVLRASAGMDYWEFAQFLTVVGLPRLSEAQLLLTSISLASPSNAINSTLSSMEQLLLKITTSSRKLTFFESGSLPAKFQLTSSVADNLASCDCLIRGAKERETNTQPFAVLYDLLPEEFQLILVNVLDKDKEKLSRQRTHAQLSQLIFRLFELITINTVLGEVLHCVSIHSE